MPLYTQSIPFTAVWLRRIGDDIEVLVEIDGEWRKAITELASDNFSHIANASGAHKWEKDDI